MPLINKLVLGTVQFGLPYGINNKTGQPKLSESLEILKEAKRNGIEWLDTAEAYYSAQNIIGTYHETYSDAFHVITKFSESSLQNSGTLGHVIQEDLKILKVNSLYGYLFHTYDLYEKYMNVEEFKRFKEEGWIGKLGVSVYTNEQGVQAASDPNIDIVQLPFNLLDNLYQRNEVLQQLKASGKEVHVRSVLLQGLLLMEEEVMPLKLRPLWKYIVILKEIAAEFKISLPQLALTYALQSNLIDKVLIGVDNKKQLLENIEYSHQSFPVESLSMIDRIRIEERDLLNPSKW
jgi:uncharacterized protein